MDIAAAAPRIEEQRCRMMAYALQICKFLLLHNYCTCVILINQYPLTDAVCRSVRLAVRAGVRWRRACSPHPTHHSGPQSCSRFRPFRRFRSSSSLTWRTARPTSSISRRPRPNSMPKGRRIRSYIAHSTASSTRPLIPKIHIPYNLITVHFRTLKVNCYSSIINNYSYNYYNHLIFLMLSSRVSFKHKSLVLNYL